jgi:peptide/nickel transport system substrate-binding protein
VIWPKVALFCFLVFLMKRLRWQILIVILALGAITVLLLSQKPNVTEQVFEAPEPVAGGAYSEALIGEFVRFNPVIDFYNTVDRDVDRLIFSSLVRFDATGLAQADLAESWGISRDGTVYNVSLNPDAVWHDGEPVTANDVVFTVSLLRNPELPIPEDLLDMWDDIEVEALDDHWVQFRLPEPFSPFLDYLAFGILPAHLLEGITPEVLIDHNFNLSPVGSGPYRFQQMLVEDEEIIGVELLAFEDYYGGRAFIDQITFRYYQDDESALEAYRAGDVQGISQITPDAFGETSLDADLNLYTVRLPRLAIILLNLDNPDVPFFQEVEIRRALLMGINRQRLIDRVLEGQAAIADGPILPNTWAYFDGIERVPFRPDEALKIIKDAGYTIPAEGGTARSNEDGVRLSFTLAHPDTPEHTALAELIQQNWADLEIDVDLLAVPYETLIDDYLDPRLYEAALVDISLSRTPDPDPYPFWHQTQATNGQNYSMWNDRPASEYLEQARIILDPAERARLYRNFQVRFSNETPALPLYHPMYTYAVSEQVQGVRMGPLFDTSDRFNTVQTWYLFYETDSGVDENLIPTP